eukprot:CAMPEP_0206495102 /NCGR_PEP_ID=MMETSP0324_2-20121206/48227_1 /ASSEMBLY_ACC=CAM_ASM_000836 /TAXON_ID=2866 /ORGANISM="Crypthecodinium cohnii, Strain Seligo" /LENGTH=77 /DNA_ID=CAMNT_0053979091 /DNA_START=254 /DNA_END=484 /DNA_ORIENTATION=+
MKVLRISWNNGGTRPAAAAAPAGQESRPRATTAPAPKPSPPQPQPSAAGYGDMLGFDAPTTTTAPKAAAPAGGKSDF